MTLLRQELSNSAVLKFIRIAIFSRSSTPRLVGTMNKDFRMFAILILTLGQLASGQSQNSPPEEQKSGAATKGVDYLVNYLNMAGTMKASEFRPLTQPERTHLYLKTMANPLGYIKAGFSAGIDQWHDKPSEWSQGASGYGKRLAN